MSQDGASDFSENSFDTSREKISEINGICYINKDVPDSNSPELSDPDISQLGLANYEEGELGQGSGYAWPGRHLDVFIDTVDLVISKVLVFHQIRRDIDDAIKILTKTMGSERGRSVKRGRTIPFQLLAKIFKRLSNEVTGHDSGGSERDQKLAAIEILGTLILNPEMISECYEGRGVESFDKTYIKTKGNFSIRTQNIFNHFGWDQNDHCVYFYRRMDSPVRYRIIGSLRTQPLVASLKPP